MEQDLQLEVLKEPTDQILFLGRLHLLAGAAEVITLPLVKTAGLAVAAATGMEVFITKAVLERLGKEMTEVLEHFKLEAEVVAHLALEEQGLAVIEQVTAALERHHQYLDHQ